MMTTFGLKSQERLYLESAQNKCIFHKFPNMSLVKPGITGFDYFIVTLGFFILFIHLICKHNMSIYEVLGILLSLPTWNSLPSRKESM